LADDDHSARSTSYESSLERLRKATALQKERSTESTSFFNQAMHNVAFLSIIERS
jgi:hypothetical protein